MKHLSDPSLAEYMADYNKARDRHNQAVAGIVKVYQRPVVQALVTLFEAADAELNDLVFSLAALDADDHLADEVIKEWDKRHPGAAHSALTDLLTGNWQENAENIKNMVRR